MTPLAESLDKKPGTDLSLSDSRELEVVDETKYCPVKVRTSCSTEVTVQRESMSSSVAPGAYCNLRSDFPTPKLIRKISPFLDTSQRSSISTSTVSDRVLSPGHETPATKELYPKPLPVIPVETAPSVPSVMCETYRIDVDADQGHRTLVNRPLPQTPHLSPSPGAYSPASLDRSLLKQQREAKLNKPNTFRTLPRPRKIRQKPLPFFNAITRSASSTDVSKEAQRLSDHVASDPKKCTLTRMKKRLSQSMDTLIASQRVSHFYENPYLAESTQNCNKEGDRSTSVDPPYSRVSDENLPKNKEHLYTRISEYMDGQDSNMNRHSYASIHQSFRARPRSKHVYISIIFGSAESVSISGMENSESRENNPRLMSISCPSLNTSSSQPNGDVKSKYPPRPHSYYPPAADDSGLYSIDPRNGRNQLQIKTNNDAMSFPGGQYQNVRGSLGIPPSESLPVSHDSTKVAPSQDCAEDGIYKVPRSQPVGPYYQNITSVGPWQDEENNNEPDNDTSHYKVPKGPAISLRRFCEILRTTSVPNGECVDQHPGYINEVAQGTCTDDGSLEICARKCSAGNAEKCTKNGERETLSTYLEGRFNGDEFDEERTDEKTDECDNKDLTAEASGQTDESFISMNRDSCIRDSYVSEESSTSVNDLLSIASSLSIDDKDTYEDQPLIPNASDVNGNAVCDGYVEKLEVRRNSLLGCNVFEESFA